MSDAGQPDTQQHPPEKTPENHQLDVRSSVDWTQYTAYRCIHCDEPCVNELGSVYARARECRDCFGIPTLDRHSVDDLRRGDRR
ncbi:hypothetical protein [Haloarcula hispanica]|uniref:hypothetical protein n=1 Tax=Haloarcula hispanica TaxID=51589 RepID=UPI0011B40A70|nr:hypothetical protein [Haloarcula hispanica]